MKEGPDFNTGVMIFNNGIQDLSEECYRLTNEQGDNSRTVDQGIINLAADIYEIQVEWLPPEYNFWPVGKSPSDTTSFAYPKVESPIIHHFAGKPKPWEFTRAEEAPLHGYDGVFWLQKSVDIWNAVAHQTSHV